VSVHDEPMVEQDRRWADRTSALRTSHSISGLNSRRYRLVVSPAIMKFINDNASRLPDLPFTLVATATAVGTADSGDVFTTNRSNFNVVFSALSGGCGIPTPTPGESSEGGTGTGTGG